MQRTESKYFVQNSRECRCRGYSSEDRTGERVSWKCTEASPFKTRNQSESSSSYLDRPPFRLEGEERREAPRDKNSWHGKKKEVTGRWEEKGGGDNCCIKIANLNERSFRSTGGLSSAQRPFFLNVLTALSMIVSPSFQPPPTHGNQFRRPSLDKIHFCKHGVSAIVRYVTN